jgi:nucleoside-diphosphate-sugar epimerase
MVRRVNYQSEGSSMNEQARTVVFVTGATGVLGCALLPLLRGEGIVVRALCRSAATASLVTQLGAIPVQGDLFDRGAMKEAVKGSRAILHLATKIPASNQMKRPEAWSENDRIRREGTQNLIEAAQAGDVDTVIYQSVCLVYPDSSAAWVDAQSSAPAAAPPLLSTLQAEKTVVQFSSNCRRGIVLRMGQFYGPQSAQTRAALQLARWRMVAVFGGLDNYHSTIWINDAANAVVRSLQRASSGILDVVDDQPLTNREFLKALANAVGRGKLWRLPRWIVRASVGKDLQDLFARSQRVQNTRLKTATGWSPDVRDASAGLSLCANALFNHPNNEKR